MSAECNNGRCGSCDACNLKGLARQLTSQHKSTGKADRATAVKLAEGLKDRRQN